MPDFQTNSCPEGPNKISKTEIILWAWKISLKRSTKLRRTKGPFWNADLWGSAMLKLHLIPCNLKRAETIEGRLGGTGVQTRRMSTKLGKLVEHMLLNPTICNRTTSKLFKNLLQTFNCNLHIPMKVEAQGNQSDQIDPLLTYLSLPASQIPPSSTTSLRKTSNSAVARNE